MNLDQLLQHREFLTSLARGLVQDPLEQEELLWETMGEGALRPPDHTALKPWLARVLTNRARARHRAERRRLLHEQAGSKPDHVESAAEVAARLELIQDLATHVQSLDTDFRDVVLFRFFENLPPREIAKRLDLPVDTVKQRLRRALALLRTRLDKEHGSRDKWLGSLIPLALPSAKASGVGLTTLGLKTLGLKTLGLKTVGLKTLGLKTVGASMMTAKTKTALAAIALLLLLGAGILYAVNQTGDPSEAGGTVLVHVPADTSAQSDLDQEGSQETARVGSRGSARVRMDSDIEGEIEGRVLDPLSEPVAKAKLYLYRSAAVDVHGASAPVVVKAESDERGVFRMQGLALGRYRIRVVAEGWSDNHARVSLTRMRPKLRGWLIRLHAGSPLSGVVVDPDGKPLAGAWIQASWSYLRGGEAFNPETRSDEEGRFSFSALPTGTKVYFLAWSEGRMLSISERIVGRSAPLRIVLSEAGPYQMTLELAEDSEDKGQKPTDVSVFIHVIAGEQIRLLPSPIRQLRVPTSGAIRTRGLCAGTYRLTMESKEADLGEYWRLQPLTEEAPTAAIKIVWRAFQRLEGRLIYRGGNPAEGIRLGAAHMWQESFFAKSDREGFFQFPRRFAPDRQATIFFGSRGFLFETAGSLSNMIQTQAGEKVGVLTVRRVPTLKGRVVDQKGRPVAHAVLGLLSRDDRSRSFGTAISNDRGEFSLAPTAETEGPMLLDVVHESMYCPEPLAMQGKGLSDREGIVLRLAEASSIEGSIVDEKGAGIAGVMVTASLLPEGENQSRMSIEWLKRRRRWKGDQRRAFSDRAGRFRVLGLAPGYWILSGDILGREKPVVQPRVELAPGERRGGVRIVLGEGLTIDGRIVTDGGEPVGNAWITWLFNGELPRGSVRSGQPIRSTPDGRFVLKGLHVGEYSLMVQPPDSLLRKMGINGIGSDRGQALLMTESLGARVRAGTKGYRWEIVLPQFGEVRARLAHRGSPLQRIQVEMCSVKDKQSFDLQVLQGAVSLKHVLAGSYDLTFKSPRFANLYLKVEIHQDRVTDLGTLQLIAIDDLEGRVVDQNGKPMAGVWIGLDEKLARLWAGYDMDKGLEQFDGRVLLQSDASGRFRVPIKDRTRILAFKPGYGPVTLTYPGTDTPKGSPPKKLILRLSETAELSIQAPAAPGDEPTYWSARLHRLAQSSVATGKKSPPQWTRAVDLEPGKPVRIIGLQPGNYRLVAMDRGKGKSFSKKSVPGESYFEEFQIQVGTKRLIKIR